jgi:hypothetical protein
MALVSGNKIEILKSIWHVVREDGVRVEREVVARLQDGEVEVFQDGSSYTPKEALDNYISEVS